MRHLLLLLLLASCASPPSTARRSTLRDGVEVAPAAEFVPPGYTPKGAGLPEYIPGAPEPTGPRSPYRRVLPQTPETRKQAGVWSAEEPRASTGPNIATIARIGIPAPEDEEATPVLKWCSDKANAALDGAIRVQRGLDQLTPVQRSCAVATILYECAFTVRHKHEQSRASNEGNRRAAKKAEEFAHALLAAACPPEAEQATASIMPSWSAAMQYGGMQ